MASWGHVVDEEEGKQVSWRRLELLGLAAFGITMTCLYAGQSLERYASQFGPAAAQLVDTKPKFNAIDYAETGATKNAVVIIGPCGVGGP